VWESIERAIIWGNHDGKESHVGKWKRRNLAVFQSGNKRETFSGLNEYQYLGLPLIHNLIGTWRCGFQAQKVVGSLNKPSVEHKRRYLMALGVVRISFTASGIRWTDLQTSAILQAYGSPCPSRICLRCADPTTSPRRCDRLGKPEQCSIHPSLYLAVEFTGRS
jgi:hypothetical protein